jgi:hypothetical protein
MSETTKEPPASLVNKVLSGTPIKRESISFTNVTTSSDEKHKNNTTSSIISPSTRRESLSYTNVQLHENRRHLTEANDALMRHDAAIITQLQQENNILKQQRIRDKTVISEFVTRTHNLAEDIKQRETLLEANRNLLQSIYKQLNILADLAKTQEIDHFKGHLSAVINTLSCHDTAIDILNMDNDIKKSQEISKLHFPGDIEQEKVDIRREREKKPVQVQETNRNDLYNIKTINDKISSFRKLFSDIDEDDKTHHTETDEILNDNNDIVDIEAILADEILMLMKENKQLKQSSMKMEKNLKSTTSTAIDLSLKEAEENSRLQLELLASNQEILKLRDKTKKIEVENSNLYSSIEEFRHREIELLQALEGVLIRVHELESNVWLDAVDMRRPMFTNIRRSPKNYRPFKI